MSGFDAANREVFISSSASFPSVGDFGILNLSTNSSFTRNFNITNRGNLPFSVNSISTDNSNFSVSGVPNTIGPGSSSSFSVRFTGTVVGQQTALLTIAHNASGSGLFRFNLQGEIANSLAEIQVSRREPNGTLRVVTNGGTVPGSLLSTDINVPITQEYRVQNLGSMPLIISNATGGGAPIPSLATTIPPGSFDDFSVDFLSSMQGERRFTVVIDSNDPTGDARYILFENLNFIDSSGNPEIEVRGRRNDLPTFSFPENVVFNNNIDFDTVRSSNAVSYTHLTLPTKA